MQNKQTNAREAYGPVLSSSSEVIIIFNAKLDRKIKHYNEEEQGKTQYETPRSTNDKATQNKNYTRTVALER